ncbi:MAG: hypothetical protein U1F87_05710 [Kiritimatiellia bacterium]
MSPHRSSRRELVPAETRFHTFGSAKNPFRLHHGGTLESVTLAYEMHGELNAERSNAILVFHALSGSHHARGFTAAVEGVGDRWTEECQTAVGRFHRTREGPPNTDKFCVTCVNYLGGVLRVDRPVLHGSPGPETEGRPSWSR